MNNNEVKESLNTGGFFTHWMPGSQLKALLAVIDGEEGAHFVKLLSDLRTRIEGMPKTYETDGQGDDAKAHLHYFLGSVDAWVTEKDAGVPGDPDQRQHQAFGKVSLTGNKSDAELGYISIQELIDNDVELDLYWDPKALKDI